MRTLTLLLFSSLAFILSPASAQSPMGDQLRITQSSTITGSYRCERTKAPAYDVLLTYQTHTLPALESRISAMSFGAEVVEQPRLKSANQAIGARTIESVVVTCSSSVIQIALTTFDSKSAKRSYLVLEKRKGSELAVLR